MGLVRGILFYTLFVVGTVFWVLAAMVAALLGTGPARRAVHSWSNMHRWLARHVLGIRFVMDGEIPEGPYLIAIKHQSMAEAVETLRMARTPVVVMKRQLTTIPLFGLVTRRYGVIAIDREAGPKALRELIAAGKAAVDSGRPVIIFPEGTRVPVGEMPELKSGFAGLYRTLGLPVVPVAVDSGRLWGRGLVKTPGTIHFKVGEVIPPGLKRAEVERLVHAAINVLEREPAA
jgi:1-acyl-sn-glycerol-3-phosphate acyltransferase